jgi:hypothetical protein
MQPLNARVRADLTRVLPLPFAFRDWMRGRPLFRGPAFLPWTFVSFSGFAPAFTSANGCLLRFADALGVERGRVGNGRIH